MPPTQVFMGYLNIQPLPGRNDVPLIKKIVKEQDEILRNLDAELEEVEMAMAELSIRKLALDSERELHKQLRDRHSALLCPILNVPNDILTEVFLAVAPTVSQWKEMTQERRVQHPLVAVSHVCSSWRKLALGTPFIWTDIPVDSLPDYFPSSSRFYVTMRRVTSMVTAFVSRAGDHPISFSLTGMDPKFLEDLTFRKAIQPLVNALRTLPWVDVYLDLRFFADESPFSQILPLHPQSRNTVRKLTVYLTGPGARGMSKSLFGRDHDAFSPRHLRSLDFDLGGQELCALNLNWASLTDISLGAAYDESGWLGGKLIAWRPTLTPREAWSIMEKCSSLVCCEIRLNPIPNSRASFDRLTLPHLRSLKILGHPAPKAFAKSLIVPSLQRISTIHESHHNPEGEAASALVEWIQRYGSQLTEVAFDYGSLNQSALGYCLNRLPNVTSLTILPSMFGYNPDASWNARSAILTRGILEKLTPMLDSEGSSFVKPCNCPKLERITVDMGPKEDSSHARLWIEFIAARRRPSIRSTSTPVAWLRRASVTFPKEAKVEWGRMVKELETRGVSRGGLVLGGHSFDD